MVEVDEFESELFAKEALCLGCRIDTAPLLYRVLESEIRTVVNKQMIVSMVTKMVAASSVVVTLLRQVGKFKKDNPVFCWFWVWVDFWKPELLSRKALLPARSTKRDRMKWKHEVCSREMDPCMADSSWHLLSTTLFVYNQRMLGWHKEKLSCACRRCCLACL